MCSPQTRRCSLEHPQTNSAIILTLSYILSGGGQKSKPWRLVLSRLNQVQGRDDSDDWFPMHRTAWDVDRKRTVLFGPPMEIPK